MFKKISKRKLIISIAALFAISLMYLIPENKPKLETTEKLEYVDIESSNIFLIDKNSYVAMTEVPVDEKDIEKKARQLLEILIVGKMESKLPSGFSAIIPEETEIIDVTYDHEVLKVNFSKDILEIKKELEEKMIESIVYTLTSIDKVEKIIIYVEGDILTKLPKTKINLPSTLDRNFGINKEFNFTNTKNITDVTIYYINQINDNYYYVPVTKYLNDDRNKIDIIIEELSVGINPNKKLKSYITEDMKVSKIIEDKNAEINFDRLYNEDTEEKIKQTIKLSICANYKLDSLIINKNDMKC